MKIASLSKNLLFNDDKVAISPLLETEISKEIRILFRKGQKMKEHKAAYPITIEIHRGCIEFTVDGKQQQLDEGDLIFLDAHIMHSLHAKEESVVRLTLSKMDTIDRVKTIVD